MKSTNKQILDIGLSYSAHYNFLQVECVFDNCSIRIPNIRVPEFCLLFPDINWENGEFIHKLKGRLVRVVTDENQYVYSIKHITEDIEYVIKD